MVWVDVVRLGLLVVAGAWWWCWLACACGLLSVFALPLLCGGSGVVAFALLLGGLLAVKWCLAWLVLFVSLCECLVREELMGEVPSAVTSLYPMRSHNALPLSIWPSHGPIWLLPNGPKVTIRRIVYG